MKATMRVAKAYDYLDVRLEEAPVPSVGAKEILVRARACGICSGDVTPWYIRKKAPVVLGHEPVGEVVQVGAGVQHLAPGARVFVHHHVPCLACSACDRGEFVQCATWRSTALDPGGMAEFFRVSSLHVQVDTLVLPETVSDLDGILVEPLACVVKSLRRAAPLEGATVLIIGLGVMGQLHVLVARHWGARTVIGADLRQVRCEKAASLGADHTIDASARDLYSAVLELTDGRGCDVVIAGPATTEAIGLGIRCAARGGTVVQFMGTPPGEFYPLDTNDIYFREIRLVPSYSAGPTDTREALRLIEQGVVRAQHVVTHTYPFGEIDRAYRTAAQDPSAIKVVVIF
ncbi:MAG: alcohol dehydrogenase catalytic domain-containing protein [Candidatus Binatia bacterium]|nr:alcohol dehydrogenase catalytic domain-containing protein [Candidatus Binatia bacterium]